jgi:acyl dehydratase/NAD(P)-dependent dehydrogenase (short-subunit alcohol dehydrogenase family)
LSAASFQVEVTAQDALEFAKVSGDWNPLHTDAEYASRTAYRRPVLHGAFSAGLLSRMAGMHLPGVECLLHNLRLRFLAPIVPPATLTVAGRVVAQSGELGRVEVTIADATTGTRYVDGSYEFSRHEVVAPAAAEASALPGVAAQAAPILVTGANGGLGRAVLAELGDRAIGVTRSNEPGMVRVPDLEQIAEHVPYPRIAGIVHCAWPAPGNERLIELPSIEPAVDFNVATPLRQCLALAQLLAERGTDGAMLLLVGSTAAQPGRHNYRMPLYTLSKALVPELTRILATELAARNRRCSAVTFDVIDGGMNKRLSTVARIAHADRIPSGHLPTLAEAAAQIGWVIDNANSLISGANISITGAAVP